MLRGWRLHRTAGLDTVEEECQALAVEAAQRGPDNEYGGEETAGDGQCDTEGGEKELDALRVGDDSERWVWARVSTTQGERRGGEEEQGVCGQLTK